MSSMDRYHHLTDRVLMGATFQVFCNALDGLMGDCFLDTDELRQTMSFALQVQTIYDHCPAGTITWPYRLDHAGFYYAAHYICRCDGHQDREEWTSFWRPTELEGGLF